MNNLLLKLCFEFSIYSCCYGPNICVLCLLKPQSRCDVIGRWGLWEGLGLDRVMTVEPLWRIRTFRRGVRETRMCAFSLSLPIHLRLHFLSLPLFFSPPPHLPVSLSVSLYLSLSYEDKTGRLPSANQEEGSYQAPGNLLAPWSWASLPLEPWETNVCFLSPYPGIWCLSIAVQADKDS